MEDVVAPYPPEEAQHVDDPCQDRSNELHTLKHASGPRKRRAERLEADVKRGLLRERRAQPHRLNGLASENL